MRHHGHSWSRTVYASALLVTLNLDNAIAQSKLPPAVDAFVTAANALAKSATERVELGRATIRLRTIRADFSSKLLTASHGKPITLAVDAEALLCDPRTAIVEAAARRNYLQAVAGRIEEIGKPSKIENLESAFKSLFTSQNLDIAAGVPTEKDFEEVRKQLRERCAQDIAEFHAAYYGRPMLSGQPVPRAAAIGVFSAIGALIEVISNVITPVVVEGSRIVDEERRRAAVLRFLKAPGNVKKIEESGMALAREVSDFTSDKRLRLAGAFVEQLAILRTTAVDLGKEDKCKPIVSGAKAVSSNGASLTDEFIVCWRAAWGQLESTVSEVLKAAEQYDMLADAGDPDNARKAFEPLAKSLATIEKAGEDGVLKLWSWAIRLVAFGQKVETAFGQESRQKVEKAIDDLVKAF